MCCNLTDGFGYVGEAVVLVVVAEDRLVTRLNDAANTHCSLNMTTRNAFASNVWHTLDDSFMYFIMQQFGFIFVGTVFCG